MYKHEEIEKTIANTKNELSYNVAKSKGITDSGLLVSIYTAVGYLYCKKCTLENQLSELTTPDDFTRIDNDTNGNPRYVCHYRELLKPTEKDTDINLRYTTALNNAKAFGGRKSHNKQYGGGIVFQSYNLGNLCESINNFKLEETK